MLTVAKVSSAPSAAIFSEKAVSTVDLQPQPQYCGSLTVRSVSVFSPFALKVTADIAAETFATVNIGSRFHSQNINTITLVLFKNSILSMFYICSRNVNE